jgi:hypothetical protein
MSKNIKIVEDTLKVFIFVASVVAEFFLMLEKHLLVDTILEAPFFNYNAEKVNKFYH